MVKYILSILIVLALASSGFSAGLTDTNVHVRPAAPPAFNATTHKATDPTFSSTIYRVTGGTGSNAYEEAGNVENICPLQHFISPWNKDSDHFIVWWDRTNQVSAAHRIREYAFNGTTYAITGYVDMLAYDGGAAGSKQPYLNYNRAVTYSNSESRVVYGVRLPADDTIAKYDFSSNTGSALTPQPDWLTIFSANNIDNCLMSEDDNLFGFWVGTGGTGKVYVVWSKSDNTYATIDITPTTSGGPWTPSYEPKAGSCFLIRSGAYVRIIGKKTGDTNTQNYVYPISIVAGQVTIGSPYHYDTTSPGYLVGKMSSYHSLNVNEFTYTFGYRYGMLHRDLADPISSELVIFGTNSRLFTHPAYSRGGTYISGAMIAYSPVLSTWTLYSGNIYQTTTIYVTNDVDYLIYKSVLMTKVGSVGAIDAAGKYYYDTATKILYVWITGGGSPCAYDSSGTCVMGGDWSAYLDEIVLLTSTGSTPVRLAHAWTNFYTNSYDEMPSAVSPDGKYIVWYGNWNGSGRHDVFMVDTSGVPDITPPSISNALPSGVQSCTSNPRNITLQLNTDELSTCKYSLTDSAFDDMANTFTTTGGTTHSQVLSLACSASYQYYSRCVDGAGNKDTSSTSISFSIASPDASGGIITTIGGGSNTISIGAGSQTMSW